MIALKYKREMYASNPNIVSNCERLAIVIHNCRVYGLDATRHVEELSQWCEVWDMSARNVERIWRVM
jgi:G:T-mismatch repair DNA endonuclease (very short patch repair protein)